MDVLRRVPRPPKKAVCSDLIEKMVVDESFVYPPPDENPKTGGAEGDYPPERERSTGRWRLKNRRTRPAQRGEERTIRF
jgi:hypothetical protein